MEQDIQKKLEEQNAKLDAIFASVEKTRKYFRLTVWITAVVIVLPVVGLIIAIPRFINTYTNLLGGM